MLAAIPPRSADAVAQLAEEESASGGSEQKSTLIPGEPLSGFGSPVSQLPPVRFRESRCRRVIPAFLKPPIQVRETFLVDLADTRQQIKRCGAHRQRSNRHLHASEQPTEKGDCQNQITSRRRQRRQGRWFGPGLPGAVHAGSGAAARVRPISAFSRKPPSSDGEAVERNSGYPIQTSSVDHPVQMDGHSASVEPTLFLKRLAVCGPKKQTEASWHRNVDIPWRKFPVLFSAIRPVLFWLCLPTIYWSTTSPFVSAERWIEDSFEDFADGSLDASGQNIYVSRDGSVRAIHRFDLNSDGHIDLLFNNTHDSSAFIPATLATSAANRRIQVSQLAVEGSLETQVADLNRDGFVELIFCPNRSGIQESGRFVTLIWGGADGWPAHRSQWHPSGARAQGIVGRRSGQ